MVTFNILRKNTEREKVLAYLQSTNADIIAVIEVNDEWVKALDPLRKTHPHIAHFPNSHNFGIAFYSKYPVLGFTRPMPTRGHPLLIAKLDYHGSLLTVVVAHPVPPMSALGAEFHNTYLGTTAATVSKLPGPVLLMGDLNTTPWSPLFSNLVSTTGLRDSGKGRGFQSTWKRRNPLFTAPIDHVLHSRELQPVARHIGPSCGSDHSPLQVDFTCTPTLPVPAPVTKPIPPTDTPPLQTPPPREETTPQQPPPPHSPPPPKNPPVPPPP